jgi:hypothetical protein
MLVLGAVLGLLRELIATAITSTTIIIPIIQPIDLEVAMTPQESGLYTIQKFIFVFFCPEPKVYANHL